MRPSTSSHEAPDPSHPSHTHTRKAPGHPVCSTCTPPRPGHVSSRTACPWPVAHGGLGSRTRGCVVPHGPAHHRLLLVALAGVLCPLRGQRSVDAPAVGHTAQLLTVYGWQSSCGWDPGSSRPQPLPPGSVEGRMASGVPFEASPPHICSFILPDSPSCPQQSAFYQAVLPPPASVGMALPESLTRLSQPHWCEAAGMCVCPSTHACACTHWVSSSATLPPEGPQGGSGAQHISHVLECSVSAPLARTESQVLLLELVVRQASAVVLRLHQPRPTAGCPRGHGHGPKEPWPAGLAVRGPGAKVALRGVSPGPLLWTFLEHGAPQPPKPRQATGTPQCPQCPKPPPQAVGPGVPYPGALATEDEASLSQPGAQSRNPSAPGPSLASRSMPALRSRPRE